MTLSTRATGSPPGAGPRSPLFDPFVAALLGVVALALVLPAQGMVGRGMSQLVAPAIAWLFFLYGVRLPTRQALTAVRDWRLQLTVLVMTYAVFPALGGACLLLSPWLLSPELARGLLFLGLVPSTVQSSIAFTSIAGGNVAGALCAASLSNLLGVFVTPLLVGWLLGGTVGWSWGSIGLIAGQLILPFTAGQVSRRWLVDWLSRHRRLLSLSDRASILLVVYVAFARGVTEGVWDFLAWPELGVLLLVCGFLLGVMLLVTSTVGRVFGLRREDRIVLLMCGSKKSLASGLPMATILLPAVSVGLLVLPLMVYHQLQLVVCSVIAQRMGRAHANTRAG